MKWVAVVANPILGFFHAQFLWRIFRLAKSTTNLWHFLQAFSGWHFFNSDKSFYMRFFQVFFKSDRQVYRKTTEKKLHTQFYGSKAMPWTQKNGPKVWKKHPKIALILMHSITPYWPTANIRLLRFFPAKTLGKIPPKILYFS